MCFLKHQKLWQKVFSKTIIGNNLKSTEIEGKQAGLENYCKRSD